MTAVVSLKLTWLNTSLEDGTVMLKHVGVAILWLYFTQIVHFVGKQTYTKMKHSRVWMGHNYLWISDGDKILTC
jgi:hypothetical protein